MAGNATPNKAGSDIRYSRILGLSTVVALGSLATVALAAFLLVDPLISFIGNQAPFAYGLFILFFFPIVLALAERAAVTRGDGGIFNLTKTSDIVGLQYWSGWLILGGYFSLAAIYALAGGFMLSTGLASLAGIEIDARLLAILVIFIVGLAKVPDVQAKWRVKTIIIYLSIIFVLALVIRLWVSPVEVTPSYAFLPSNDPMSAIPYLALGLWGISFILDHREEMRQPRKRMLSALSIPLLLGGLIGIIVTIVLLQYSGIVATQDRPLFALAAEITPLTQLLLLLAAVILSFSGLSQSLASNIRLTKTLVSRGFVPERLLVTEHKIQPYLVIPFPLVVALMVGLLPFRMIVGAAAASLLLAITLAIGQDVFSRKPNLPENRRLKLPLHPLIPATAAIISLAMALAQPVPNHLLLLAWIVAGVAYYIAYGRQGAVAARQRGRVVTDKEFERERAPNGILVHIADLKNADQLVQAGAALAKARARHLTVLYVIENPEEQSELDRHPEAQIAWQTLRELLASLNLEGLKSVPLVRLAPTIPGGILATIWDEQVATVFLGWPAGDVAAGELGLATEDVDYLVTHSPSEVVVLRGALPDPIERILVPMTSQSHNLSALALAQDLARGAGARVKASGIVRGRASQEALDKARANLQTTVAHLKDPADIDIDLLQVVKAPDDLYRAAGDCDLIIMGASEEGFLTPTSFIGFPAELVEAADRPGIVNKKHEKPAAYWLRQAWETLFRFLPKLDRKERAGVYRSMNQNARATVDFYVLILLAAGIAFLGLLLNSSSVIIGAMLIAPLMNPMLAMANAIVMGNLRMLRSAASSVLNGVILAVGISAFLALMLFAIAGELEPTDEILSRTSPNVLDLLVALLSGAAAAYAVSRSQLASALPGVAIAAALVPPLCVVGFGLGTGKLDIALGSGLLFLTNLAAIIVAAAVIFLLVGFRPPIRLERGEQARLGLKTALMVLLVIAIILVVISAVSVKSASDRSTIESMLTSAWPPDKAQVVNLRIERKKGDYIANFTVLDYTSSITQSELDKLQQDISVTVHDDVVLRTSIVNSRLDVAEGTPRPTPTMTQTLEPMATLTLTPTLKSTATPVPSPTFTPTFEPSTTLTPEPTATPEATSTPIEEATAEPTSTPTETPVVTPTEALPPEPTDTPEGEVLVVTPFS